jgi:hypothetical protein
MERGAKLPHPAIPLMRYAEKLKVIFLLPQPEADRNHDADTESQMASLDGGDSVDRAIADLHENRIVFESFCKGMHRLIGEIVKQSGISVHSFEWRVKDVISFRRKAQKRNDDGSMKYVDPLKEITDISGVRIIVFTLKDVERIESLIKDNFDVV